MRMEITPHSGISADGFKVEIISSKEVTVARKSYAYGYDASYSPTSDEKRPYTTDIIAALMSDYKVKIDEITVRPGVYVFSGTKMTEGDCIEFIEKYLVKLGYEKERVTWSLSNT